MFFLLLPEIHRGFCSDGSKPQKNGRAWQVPPVFANTPCGDPGLDEKKHAGR
jgi:hypothetical protein